MKRHCFTSYPLFALIGLILSPQVVAHASDLPTGSVHFCAPFDYEQWRREHPRPAGKRLAALDAGEPRTVRMIYFLPNDRPYSAAVFGSVKTKMRQMHTFFANQMSAHGYGSEGFRSEKDAAGQPQVHRVNGQHPLSHYLENDTAGAILEEIDSTFDIESNIYFIVIDTNGSGIRSGDRLLDGVGSASTKKGGFALVPSKNSLGRESNLGTDAHELGHAFGLHHDFRNDSYLMSYGFVPDRLFDSDQLLSACNADFLAVHAYFNRQIPTDTGTLHTIEELTSSPIHTADRTSVPVRIKVRDPDGLSQLMLLAQTKRPHFAEGFQEVKDCRGFDGQTDHTFEFDYDGVVPSLPESDFYSFREQSLIVQALDALGNSGFSDRFELINNKFRSPIADFTVPIAEDGFISSINFSPEGNLYAFQVSHDDNRLKLLNVSTGRSIASFPPRGHIDILAFSADNKWMALESDEYNIEVWDIENRRRLVTIDAPHEGDAFGSPAKIASLVFSPDGKLLASGGWSDYAVHLWNTARGDHVSTLPNSHRGPILSLVFSPDGKRLASFNSRGTIKVWDIASKKNVATIRAHEGPGPFDVWSFDGLSFSDDGKLLASAGAWRGDDIETSEIKLWDVATGDQVASLPGSAPLVFSPDGRFIASGSAAQARSIDLDGIEGGITRGSIVGGGSVKLWDVNTWEPVNSFPTLWYITELAFSSDMRLLAESSLSTVRLWDLSEWTRSPPHSLVETSDDEMDNGEEEEGEEDDGEEEEGKEDREMAFGFAEEVEDQAYTAGTTISALVLPEAIGGEGEITYRVSELPAGLSFDATTRTISGTPEAATDGAVEVTYTAQDSAEAAATLTFSITVNPALSFGDFFDLFN